MHNSAIVDTSALIALDKLGLLYILCELYDNISIPRAVTDEFGEVSLECGEVKNVESDLLRIFRDELNLGRGESEVLALAHQSKERVVIDDQKARHLALRMGLRLTGTIGILLKAEQSGLIESAYDKAVELKNIGFFVSDKVLKTLSRLGSSS